MHLIDLHMAVMPSERKDWTADMLLSLGTLPDRERSLFKLHIINGTKGNIGEMRARGFALGSAPYVGWVDPDDLTLPGGIASLHATLAEDPTLDVVYTPEEVMDFEGKLHGVKTLTGFHHIDAHHIVVIKRELVQAFPLKEWQFFPERALVRSLVAQGAKFKCTGVPGYAWRYHYKQWHVACDQFGAARERTRMREWHLPT